MKKITLCLVAMMFATLAMAQDFRRQPRMDLNPENMAAWQTNQLKEVLQLDSMQYQLIFLMNYADAVTLQDSMKVRRARAEKLRAEGKTPQRPTDEERATQMKIREAREQIRNEQMKQILTPEQFEKYLKFNEEQKARMRNRAPGHRNHHEKQQ